MRAKKEISVNDEIAEILARDKKYITCLHLVELVVNKELGVILNRDYYENLGKVASFIDRALDSLKLRQKARFLEDFDRIFTQLTASENQLEFNSLIFRIIDQYSVVIRPTVDELQSLRTFIQFQKKYNLLEHLNSFGKNIISISIRQELASTSSEIAALLKQEGKLVIGLLESNLIQFTANIKSLNQTIDLLTDFEQILNLGDDLLDVKKDINANRINLKITLMHRVRLFILLGSQIIKTFLKNPMKCLYYYPRCSVYYAINSR